MEILTAQDTPVIAKTKELCQTILDQASFADLKGKIDAFTQDAEAQSLYQSLVQKQESLMAKQQQGEQLSEEDINAFEGDREALLAHPISGGFIRAQKELEELQNSINLYLSKTFELGTLPTDQDIAGAQQGGGGGGGCCGGGGGDGGGGGGGGCCGGG